MSGAPKQALGPLLLVFTNFGAILLTGLIVMAIYRVRATAVQGLGAAHGRPRLAAVVVVAFVVVLAAPLAVDSAQITSQQLADADVTTVADTWANKVGWQGRERLNQRKRGLGTDDWVAGAAQCSDVACRPHANGLKSTSVQLVLDPVKRVDLPGR